MWIFIIELTTIAIIFKVVVFDVEEYAIFTSSYEILATRFICAMLLHMEL